MFIHSALFWLRPDLTAQDRQHFEEALARLTRISYLEAGWAGPSAATPTREVTDKSFDYATSLHFKSLADHEYYQTQCPDHAAFVAACKHFWVKVVVHDIQPMG